MKPEQRSCRLVQVGHLREGAPRGPLLDGRLAAAARAGYQFVEISIDESDDRAGASGMAARRRGRSCTARSRTRPPPSTRCASAPTASTRWAARPGPSAGGRWTIMRRAIDFAAEFGIRIVQVAGYDVSLRGIHRADPRPVPAKASCSPPSGRGNPASPSPLENVECPVVDSIEKGMRFVQAADTPWFQMYPDIGNLTAMEKDVTRELLAGGRHVVGLHLKDTRIREFRRVPLRRRAGGLRRRVPHAEPDGLPGALHGRDVERGGGGPRGDRCRCAPVAGAEARRGIREIFPLTVSRMRLF